MRKILDCVILFLGISCITASCFAVSIGGLWVLKNMDLWELNSSITTFYFSELFRFLVASVIFVTTCYGLIGCFSSFFIPIAEWRANENEEPNEDLKII